MKRILFTLLVTVLLAGCGPRELSPKEIAAQKARDAAQAQRQQAAQIHQKAIDAKRAAEAEQRKKEAEAKAANLNIIAHNKDELAKDPLPPGVHQIGSAIFLGDPGKTSGLRHVCTGRYDDGGNDVQDAQVLSGGSIKVTCKGSVEHYRDETWQQRYLFDKAHGIGMPGVMFANPALQKSAKVGGKT